MSFQTRCYDRARQERLAVVKTGSAEHFKVESRSQGIARDVELIDGTFWLCSCPSYEHRAFCVHIATADLARKGLL